MNELHEGPGINVVAGEKSIKMFEEMLEKLWKDMPPNRFGYDGTLDIYDGWSNNDESDPNRYWMESYRMGSLMTGRGGIKKAIEDGDIFFNRVIYNGTEIPVELFLSEFKRIADAKD